MERVEQSIAKSNPSRDNRREKPRGHDRNEQQPSRHRDRHACSAVEGRRRDREDGGQGADCQAPSKQQQILAQNNPNDVRSLVAHGGEQRELASSLEDVPEQHGREAERADDQPKSPQRLERRDVGVLNRVELREAVGGCARIGTEIRCA